MIAFITHFAIMLVLQQLFKKELVTLPTHLHALKLKPI